MKALKLLETLINEHGSSTILKERLELLRDQLRLLESENEQLRVALESERAESARLRALVPDARFVEHRGAKFKRKPSGGFDGSVYCPSCELGMATIPGANMPFTCGKCKALSGFTERELKNVLVEVETEYPSTT